MKPYIKHDRWGDPVCCDCEHAFREGERAMIVDNEVICWDCVEKWAEDDLADLLDHIASGDARTIFDWQVDEISQDATEEAETERQEEMEMIMHDYH